MYISRRNKKLIPTNDVKFLIWSLPAVITCPNRTALCEQFCYAKKSEQAYKDVLPCRMQNLEDTKKDTFVDDMTAFIQKACNHYLYRNAKRIVFRIHESGDFYSLEYYKKWLAIAKNCENIKNLVFMAYTKSVKFVAVDGEIPSNMTIRYSLWSDTEPSEKALAESLGLPVYTAVEKFTNEPKKEQCECVSCATCNKCWCKAIEMLKCEIH